MFLAETGSINSSFIIFVLAEKQSAL